MADYIEREAAINAISIVHGELIEIGEVIDILDEMPAADVQPVKHGQWIADGDGYHWTYNCSICGWKDGYPFNERHNFCPNCGAKMDGET